MTEQQVNGTRLGRSSCSAEHLPNPREVASAHQRIGLKVETIAAGREPVTAYSL
jgi:hypothetical protein